jgi:undecaprenyl-diphosphatase
MRGNGSAVTRAPAATTAALLALATALFAALTLTVLAWNEADRIDVRFVTWVHGASPEALVDLMRVLTYLGSAALLGPIALLAGVLLMRRGYPRATAYVFAAFLCGELLSQGVKQAVERRRPELDEPFVVLSTYAFPSGHAFTATTTWGALAVVAWSLAPDRRRGGLAVVGATAAVAIVASSRVVLGVHYMLDVLAGISGGVAVLAALLLLLGPLLAEGPVVRLGRKQQPQRERVDPQLEGRLERDRLAVDRSSGDGLP